VRLELPESAASPAPKPAESCNSASARLGRVGVVGVASILALAAGFCSTAALIMRQFDVTAAMAGSGSEGD